MIELRNVKLADIFTFKNGKKKPNENGNIPIYGGNGILGYTNKSNYSNCIVVGRVGVYCGSVFYEANDCWISDNAIAALPNNDVDIYYAYYLLKSLHLNERHIGTSQPLMTQEILNRIECQIPSFEIQKSIAAMLQMLDGKIEVNAQINRNLTQQAKALYKAWIMDFEPYGGEMPSDWHLGTVEEIIELHDSKRKPLSSRERDTMEKIYPYYGATSVMDYVDNYIFDGIYLLLGEDGSVVDSDGYPILQYVSGKFWPNNHAHIITGKNGFSVETLYLLFSLTNIQNIVTGAVQQKVSQQNLKKVEAVIPSVKAITEFDDIIQPMFEELRRRREENEKLASLRDSLLPKLMSGELDVSVLDI